MKKLGILFAIALTFVICFSFASCGNEPSETGEKGDIGADEGASQISGNVLTKENVAGTGWQCTYHEENGDKVYRRFILSAEGEYEAIIAINELFSHKEKGTYEVKGGKLYLYLDGNLESNTVYEYKNGNLFNNGNEFTTYAE